jgi:translation initiation factor 5B
MFLATLQVDRIFGWKTCNAPIRKAMKQQSKDVKNEFNMKVTQVVKNISFYLQVVEDCFC